METELSVNNKAQTEVMPVLPDVPIWYTREEMIQYLLRNNYSQQISDELSEKWAYDLQESFRKGFEKGLEHGR